MRISDWSSDVCSSDLAVPMEFSWAGALCLSRNHVPAFGEVEPGLYAACCENGLGTVKSTLAGMMAAELATNTSSDHLRQYQQQPTTGRLPPAPLTWLCVNSVNRWHHLRADIGIASCRERVCPDV